MTNILIYDIIQSSNKGLESEVKSMKTFFIIFAIILSASSGVKFINALTDKKLNVYKILLSSVEIIALGFVFRFSIFIY